MSSSSSSPPSSRKRTRAPPPVSKESVFDAVEHLTSQDVHRSRRKWQSSSTTQRRQSYAAQSQTKLHGHLMECRILLQRVLLLVPKAASVSGSSRSTTETSRSSRSMDETDPNNNNPLHGETSTIGNEEEKEETTQACVDACDSLLAQLLAARSLLRFEKDDTNKNDNTMDNNKHETYDTKGAYYLQLVQQQQQQLDDNKDTLDQVLESEYQDCRDEWKRVLNQKQKDMRLHAGLTAKSQFRVMDATFWKQVESTVAHEELRQRATRNHSTDGTSSSTSTKTGSPTELLVFDDSKVYQHLLQDFLVSSKGGGAEEAAAERLRRATRSKTKKVNQVDRRASKGRKIRYNVIPKLVNYTFPVSRPLSAGMMDEDEWFKSLFGGVSKQSK